MADILSISSIVLFVLSFIFLLMSIFIWKKYKILEVYKDWTGKASLHSLEQKKENAEHFVQTTEALTEATTSLINQETVVLENHHGFKILKQVLIVHTSETMD